MLLALQECSCWGLPKGPGPRTSQLQRGTGRQDLWRAETCALRRGILFLSFLVALSFIRRMSLYLAPSSFSDAQGLQLGEQNHEGSRTVKPHRAGSWSRIAERKANP